MGLSEPASGKKKPEGTLYFFTLLVAGLGYFIDSYDAFLFNIVRSASLGDLGLSGEALTRAGVFILNCQVTGTLLGGLFWGLLGDRLGRKKALLGSILAYSAGMLANALVRDVNTYAMVRALVGFGIAGEVGLGATLVAEIVPARRRTFSLALFTALGLAGVAAAALGLEAFTWRQSCLLGCAGGLALLILRGKLFESPLFLELAERKRPGWRFSAMPPVRDLFRWAGCALILMPNFFVTGLLLTLAPEMARAGGVSGPVAANIALAFYFTAAIAGDLLSAALSAAWNSRRYVLLLYLLGNAGCALIYVRFTPASAFGVYTLSALWGLFNLWAAAAAVAVEQFGTGSRATVTATSMNVARAGLVPMNLAFLALKPLGVGVAALTVGGAVFGAGFSAALLLPENYHRRLEAEFETGPELKPEF
jgi:MFS family permease